MLKFQFLPVILLPIFLSSCVSVSVDRNKKQSASARVQGEAIAQPIGAPQPQPQREMTIVEHEIVSGDSLWKIARQYETSVADIKEANQLDSDVIIAGQTLKVPTYMTPEGEAGNDLGVFERVPAGSASTAPPPPPVIIPPITSS